MKLKRTHNIYKKLRNNNKNMFEKKEKFHPSGFSQAFAKKTSSVLGETPRTERGGLLNPMAHNRQIKIKNVKKARAFYTQFKTYSLKFNKKSEKKFKTTFPTFK